MMVVVLVVLVVVVVVIVVAADECTTLTFVPLPPCSPPTPTPPSPPKALGLAIIPTLPFTIDSPIEHFIEEAFEVLWPIPNYGHHSPAHEMELEDTEVVAPAADKTKKD